MSKFPYHFFDEYVVRTPVFSYKTFIEHISKDQISDDELKEIYSNTFFQEAVYLASPYLYDELKQWIYSEKEFSPKDHYRLKNTLLKYYSRISSRPTPFGLFSGVGIGTFIKEGAVGTPTSSIPKYTDSEKVRDTKLDMHFLVSLSQHFATLPEIKNKLLFYPNTSIYTIGKNIRYIEYQYTNGKREYIVSSAPLSEELEYVLRFSEEGKTIRQIAEILIGEDISNQEATEFIEELIDNQVLISELEPHVSGGDFLHTLISILKLKGAEKEANTLVSIQRKIKELDKNIGNSISSYQEIEDLITTLQTTYEKKFLFQTDLYYQNKKKLPIHWKKELKKGICFLNKITLLNKDTHLEKFKKAFSERFEAQEVPLMYALDTETGIAYRQDTTAKGIHPYLEDLKLPSSNEKRSLHVQLNPVNVLFNQKLQEAQFENTTIIELTDEDFEGFGENWNNVPQTMSFMTEIISENGKKKLVLNGGSGSSAANLLARFCSGKSEISNLVKNIAEIENTLNSDQISAEIIHLPEARIGNIIRRSQIRNYEIPYLAQSALPKENRISTDDLYISLKQNRIILRSKKLNKEIVPYLTNAHNYSVNSLPVYHFLCDLYSQDIRSGLYFDWGDLKYIYSYFPRIEYKNVVLSKAQWKITEKDIQDLDSIIDDKEQFLNQLTEWRTKRKIPTWIQWVRNDNTLTISLENYDMVKLFIQIIKKGKTIFIHEFVCNDNEDFMHQFVFSMYKEKNQKSEPRTKSKDE